MYRVLVSNIGNVETTRSYNLALATFNEYVEQSKTNYGRAGGESVILLDGTEVLKEYFPPSED